jgi:hypothetical protein
VLDEELLVLLASVSSRQSAGAELEVEECEASQSGQAEVSQGDLVRRLFYLSGPNLELMESARTRIGESHPITYHAYIWGEVPFTYPRAEPVRPYPCRRLAITPSRHSGSCLLLYTRI